MKKHGGSIKLHFFFAFGAKFFFPLIWFDLKFFLSFFFFWNEFVENEWQWRVRTRKLRIWVWIWSEKNFLFHESLWNQPNIKKKYFPISKSFSSDFYVQNYIMLNLILLNQSIYIIWFIEWISPRCKWCPRRRLWVWSRRKTKESKERRESSKESKQKGYKEEWNKAQSRKYNFSTVFKYVCGGCSCF